MPTSDPLAQIAALQATIAQCTALLNSGTTQAAENGRMMRFDLTVVRQQLNDATTQLALLTTAPRQVRRLLTSTPSRGY